MSREGQPLNWLHASEKDRQAAYVLLGQNLPEPCVFHCQQAVEKLLKAIIVLQTQKRPPHTHDLRALLTNITDLAISREIAQTVSQVDAYYLGTRYPLDVVDPTIFTRPLAESAVRDMDVIFTWFLAQITFGTTSTNT